MPWWKKALLGIGVFVVGVLAALAAVFGREQLTRGDVAKLQKKDEASKERELAAIDRERKLKTDVVNFQFDNKADEIKITHTKMSDSIRKDLKDEAPSDAAGIAAALLNESKRGV